MYRECFVCGKLTDAIERHHLIGGTANRRLSDRYGLVVDLCVNCHRRAHRDNDLRLSLHQYGQLRFMDEQGATIDDFIKIFGKNYLTKGDCDDDKGTA